MTRIAFGAVVAVLLWGGVAGAQPSRTPAFGGVPLPGDLFGYSPLVPTIDPYPSRTSGYAPSMFLPRVGGKRIYPPPAIPKRHPVVVADAPAVVAVPEVPPLVLAAPGEFPVPAGPVVRTLPTRGWQRFGR